VGAYQFVKEYLHYETNNVTTCGSVKLTNGDVVNVTGVHQTQCIIIEYNWR
jgi:hypothetical protein